METRRRCLRCTGPQTRTNPEFVWPIHCSAACYRPRGRNEGTAPQKVGTTQERALARRPTSRHTNDSIDVPHGGARRSCPRRLRGHTIQQLAMKLARQRQSDGFVLPL